MSSRKPSPDQALFLWLFAAGCLGVLAGIPFSFALLEDPAVSAIYDSRTLIRDAVVEALILLPLASAVGLWLGKRTGLGARLPHDFVSRSPKLSTRVRVILTKSAIVGLAIGGVAMAAESSAPEGALGAGLRNPTPLEWVMRSFSAAMTEEIFFRLGLMTFFVWLLRSVVRKPEFDEGSLQAGNVLAALVFGAAHLPNLITGTFSAEIVTGVLIFNGAAGVAMGWLYQRYGLISAMGAHFIADAIKVIPLMSATASPGST